MSVCISACPGLLSCILLACPRLYVHVSMAASLHGVHACMFMSACLQVCVSMSKSTWLFTILLAASSCHYPQVPSMSAYPCLHVRKCMSACPCLLSCMFACPFGFFFAILLLSYPTSPRSCLHIHVCMSVNACLHVHVCLAACLHVLLDFFLRFCSCHTPQVPSHVCISLSACPYMHFCMSMFS